MSADDDARFDCLVKPMIVTDVGSPEQGVIRKVLAHRGTRVARGDALVHLDDDVQALGFDAAAARVGMSGEIAAREAERDLAALDLARAKALHGDDLLPKEKLDEAIARHRLAVSALDQARDNHGLARVELDRVRMQLERRVIRSPLSGVVVEQRAFEGEFVHDNPVMTIAQLDPLRVEVVLPGTLFGSIAPGDPARVHLELDAEAPVATTVERVDPFLDPRSGTFTVLLLLPNADLGVVSGQNCAASFAAPTPAVGARAAARIP